MVLWVLGTVLTLTKHIKLKVFEDNIETGLDLV